MPVGFRDFQGDYRNPLAVCRWIEENVPCTTGLIAEEWTSAVFDEARRRHISHATVSVALTLAKKDGYNFAAMLWSANGPVYVPTQSKALESALMAFDSTALVFSERFIKDARVRANYVEQAKAASRELEAFVAMGEMSAEEAALKINEFRNALLEASRLNSSDIGRAFAVVEKATGLTMEKLQAKYAAKLFKKEFAILSAAERDTVLMEIVRAGGRRNPKFTGLAAKLGKAGKGLLIVSFAFAAYNWQRQIGLNEKPSSRRRVSGREFLEVPRPGWHAVPERPCVLPSARLLAGSRWHLEPSSSSTGS